jgi:hypothetical protein
MDNNTAIMMKIICDLFAIIFNSASIVILTISLVFKEFPYLAGIICLIIGWTFLISGKTIKWKWIK